MQDGQDEQKLEGRQEAMKKEQQDVVSALLVAKVSGRRISRHAVLLLPLYTMSTNKREGAPLESADKRQATGTSITSMATPTQSTSSFLVQKLKKNAKVPTRGSSHAAGYDLYACVPWS